MSDGDDVVPATMEGITSTLLAASTSLESMTDPPSAPEAGACTATVAAALALLTESIGGASEGLTVIGGAVSEANASYRQQDADAGSAFRGVL